MDSPLEEYVSKRDFDRTPEPEPREREPGRDHLAFVVHKHAASRLHYDFRLELDGLLKSWAVPRGPSMDPKEKRLAIMVEDHPLEYAAFEGVIPEGEYGAGQVIVWDKGIYSPDGDNSFFFGDRRESEKRVCRGLAEGKLSLFLWGGKLAGSFGLVKMGWGENSWLLVKHDDLFAEPESAVLADDRSVLSGRTIEELKGEGQAPHQRAARL